MTRDWYAERDTGDEEHPVDDEVRRRLGRGLIEMDRRILALKNTLAGSKRTRKALLELEALLNERASLREAAYYNAGVDDGRAHGVLDALLEAGAGSAQPEEALRVIASLGSTVALLARRVARTLRGAPRVLLVEDDPLLAKTLARILSEHAHVRSAANAEQALAAIHRDDFDVVVTDLHLGGRDGLWLLGKAQRIRPAAKRVLMSASDVDADAITASGLAHAFVPKADLPGALVPTLQRVLDWPR